MRRLPSKQGDPLKRNAMRKKEREKERKTE